MSASTLRGRPRRRAALVLLAIACLLLAIAFFTGQRHYVGYCADQGRALSDRELILHVLNKNLSTIGQSGASSAEEFIARYPDCCSIYPDSLYSPQHWFERIVLGRRRAVDILINVPPEVHSGFRYSRYEVIADVWACGEPGATYGELVRDN